MTATFIFGVILGCIGGFGIGFCACAAYYEGKGLHLLRKDQR